MGQAQHQFLIQAKLNEELQDKIKSLETITSQSKLSENTLLENYNARIKILEAELFKASTVISRLEFLNKNAQEDNEQLIKQLEEKRCDMAHDQVIFQSIIFVDYSFAAART